MWAGDPRETPMALRKPKYRYRDQEQQISPREKPTRNRNLPVSRAALAVIMLPVDLLREILKHLDTKLLHIYPFPTAGHVPGKVSRPWTGTQRMQNSARLRRRVGQTGYTATLPIYQILDFTQNGWTVPDFPF